MDDLDKLRNLIIDSIKNYKDFTGVTMWESSSEDIPRDHGYFNVTIPAHDNEDLWQKFRKIAVARYGKGGQLENGGKK